VGAFNVSLRVVPSVPWLDVGLLDLAGFDLESPWVAVYDLPLGVLELSTRPRTILANKSIDSIGDLVALTDDDVLAMTNMGPESYVEIVAALSRFQVSLKENKWSSKIIAENAERMHRQVRHRIKSAT